MNLLPIIEKTLLENLADTASAISSSNQSGTSAIQHEVVGGLDSGADQYKHDKKSEKRKREKDQDKVEETTFKRRAIEARTQPTSSKETLEHRRKLYMALRTCLNVVLSLTETTQTFHGASEASLSTSVLSADSQSAATLLGAWLSASDMAAKNTDGSSNFTICSLEELVKIWKRRLIKVGDPSSNTLTIFSKHCLVPTLTFLHNLKHSSGNQTHRQRQDKQNSRLISILERLLAEHVILPAKRQARRQEKSTKPDDDTRPQTTLGEILKPLSDNPATHAAIPELFELAIRCIPMSTPKRRIAESPWLEQVFTALATSLGCNPHDSPSASHRIPQFGELVQLISKHRVVLKRDTTEAIIKNYASNSDDSWQLLAELIKIDSGLFVDNEVSLRDVFKRLGPVTSTHAHYTTIRDEILLPLLKALVAARSLKKFLDLWQDAVKTLFRQDPAPEQGLIWEDLELVKALSSHLDIALTTRQLSDLLNGYSEGIIAGKDIVQTSSIELLTANASLLSSILLALRSVDSTRTMLSKLEELYVGVRAHLKSRSHSQAFIQGRLWHLFAALHQVLFSVSAEKDTERMTSKTHEFETLAQECLARAIESGSIDFEILNCISTVGSIYNDLQGRNHGCTQNRFGLLQQLGQLLEQLCISDSTSLPEHLHNLVALSKVLLEYPALLPPGVSYLYGKEPGDLHRWLIQASEPASQPHDLIMSWKQIVFPMVEELCISINAQLGAWTGASAHERSASTYSIKNIYDQAVLPESETIPVELIDSTVESMQTLDSQEISGRLSLLLWYLLRSTSKRASSLFTKPEVLVSLAANLGDTICNSSTRSKDEATLLPLFRAVCQQIVSFHEQHKGEKASEQYIEAGSDIFNAVYETCSDHPADGPGSLALLKYIIGVQLFQVDVNQICNTVCQRLSKDDVQNVEATAAEVNLLCAIDMAVLSKYTTRIESIIRQLVLSQAESELLRLATFQLGCRLKLAGSMPPDLTQASALLTSLTSESSIRSVEKSLVETAAASPNDARFAVFKSLEPNDAAEYDEKQLRILHCLVKATKAKAHKQLLPEEVISSITASLQLYLTRASSITSFAYTARTLRTLLDSHGRHLPQLVIESMLSSIVTICSPTSNNAITSSPQACRTIFTLTAALLQSLLTHHRRKLRGRFDILVPALQALLRCLFVGSGTSTYGQLQQPHWIPRKQMSSSIEDGIGAQQVTAFTRLITALCDPTLSAVRSNAKAGASGPLTDETRKAKRYAGQYVQFVLMELCECQLKGRLAGTGYGAREALTPAVWAMFEVIGKDGLSATMEGMAGGGRSVLRSWWEEWKRLGRARW